MEPLYFHAIPQTTDAQPSASDKRIRGTEGTDRLISRRRTAEEGGAPPSERASERARERVLPMQQQIEACVDSSEKKTSWGEGGINNAAAVVAAYVQPRPTGWVKK